MSILSRISAAASCAVTGFSTGQVFTAAGNSETRTDTGHMPLDSRREVTWANRMQLIKKSRWLDNNLGLMRRLKNGTTRYSIGSGLQPIPDTTDKNFNREAESYFMDWASMPMLCDVRQKLSFWRMQRAMVRGMFRDGGSFLLKAPKKDEPKAAGGMMPGVPRVRWHEATTVGNLFGMNSGLDDAGFREGMRSNDEGAVLQYRFLFDQTSLYDQTREQIVDAQDAVYLADSERASQLHGLPWVYHGANSAIDILDLTALEKHAEKLHAAMAAVIKKKGQPGKAGFTGTLERRNVVGRDNKIKVISFENFAGGAGILQLGIDEEFALQNSNRQSQVFTGFLDWLVKDVALGWGVTPEFIWGVAGLQGPGWRWALEDAAWFFEEIQDLVVEVLCRPVYAWVIARAIERGELRCKDPRYWTSHWQGPRKVTIDEGKAGQLELERLKMGCMTWEEYWAARGRIGQRMVFKRIDEIALALAYAKSKTSIELPDGTVVPLEGGVPFEYVLQTKTAQPAQPGDGQRGVPDPEDALATDVELEADVED